MDIFLFQKTTLHMKYKFMYICCSLSFEKNTTFYLLPCVHSYDPCMQVGNVFIYVCHSMCLCVCLFVCITACLSVFNYFCVFLNFYGCLSECISVSVCLCVCLSDCDSVSQFVHLIVLTFVQTIIGLIAYYWNAFCCV